MTRFLIAGEAPVAPGVLPMEQVRSVSPEFFDAMGLQLKQGRRFERKDIEHSSDLIIINEAFAKRYLSGKDPLTSSILMNVLSPHPEKMPVIGVVSNARDLGVETEAEPVLYFPGFGLHAVFLIRTHKYRPGEHTSRSTQRCQGTRSGPARSITSRQSMMSFPILSPGSG